MCIASVSCVKQKLESTYNSQENRIDQYIEKNRISGTDTLRVVYNGGASRLVTKEGNGPELSADGNIAFYYAGYTFSGSISNSNLFSTNHQQTATQAGWTLSEEDAKALSINMNDYKLLPGLKSGLTGVKGGEECQILFTGKYGSASFLQTRRSSTRFGWKASQMTRDIRNIFYIFAGCFT